MNVNWPERLWCNSFLRRVAQRREVSVWRNMHSIKPGGDFLEIGCGNGAGARMVLHVFRPKRIVALDTDPAMLRRAAKRLNGERTRITLLQADAQNIPLPDASMDAAVNFGIIHHLEDWARGLRELGRVLRPGGVFLFEEIFPPLYANALMKRLVAHPTENRFHEPEFKDGLAAAGLRLSERSKQSRFGMVGVAVKEN
jgi:ubiquinone/menaquinone biosynthesis C-methylase UbiE